VTDSNTPSAENTQVVIAIEKGIIFFDFHFPIDRWKIHLIQLNGLNDVLKVTSPIIRTKHTSGRFPNFPDSGFVFVAILFLRANQTSIGVLCQNEPQNFFAGLTKLGSIGFHDHAIFDVCAAGGSKSSSPLNLNDTQPTAAKRAQKGMVTQSRDGNTILTGHIQYRFFSFCLDLFSIKC
jgi:hypothetical protein